MKHFKRIFIIALALLAAGCKEKDEEEELILPEFYLKTSEILSDEAVIDNYKQFYYFRVYIEEEAYNRYDERLRQRKKEGIFENTVDFGLINGTEIRTYSCLLPFSASAMSIISLSLYSPSENQYYLSILAYKRTITAKGPTDEERLDELFEIGNFLGLRMTYNPELKLYWDI